MRRKGELSWGRLDRDWPHQVAVRSDYAIGLDDRHVRSRFSSLAMRGRSVYRDNHWYRVFCFSDAAHAAEFMAFVGGEPHEPRRRRKAWERS